jgi:hypothetical protein
MKSLLLDAAQWRGRDRLLVFAWAKTLENASPTETLGQYPMGSLEGSVLDSAIMG